MKFIIETDSEEFVEEIRGKVDRMAELDTHAMEKNPEKLADNFIDTLFDRGDVFKTPHPYKHDKLKQPLPTNVITIEDLKKHLIILFRIQVAELFVKEEEK